MSDTEPRRNLPVYRHLHPAIYAAMAGSVAASVLALWFFFDDGAGTTLTLLVVTGFAAAFVGTPFVLWRVSPHAKETEREGGKKLSTWLEGEFEADRGVIGAKQALVMILLLPAAGAVGLTAVSFIAYLAAIGAL